MAVHRSDDLGAAALAFGLKALRLETMDDLSAAVFAAISALGLTAAASGYVSGPRAASGDPFHFNNWPSAWATLYMSENFVLIDPIPRWARNVGAPTTWSDLINGLPQRDPGHRVIKAARRFGYTEGMVVPTRTVENFSGLISFGGSGGPLSEPEQIFLSFVGHAAFEAAERIERGGRRGKPAAIFSAREIECLTLLVRGHSDGQIAAMLGLSEATARFHLLNARVKSGAVSRTHLAALAITQGFAAL
jgi:DNA-binding CsgD family transcriptional regulator